MKRLAVLRHAKSDWGDPDLDDFDRPLNARGTKAARRIGEEMKARGLSFDLVLASTAKRVRETLEGVTETFGTLPIRFDAELYLASEQLLLDRIRAVPDDAASLLLVGHNPGVERLVADLSRDDEGGLRNRVIAGFPTAALALLELPADQWTDTRHGEADFVDLILPRELG